MTLHWDEPQKPFHWASCRKNSLNICWGIIVSKEVDIGTSEVNRVQRHLYQATQRSSHKHNTTTQVIPVRDIHIRLSLQQFVNGLYRVLEII